MQKQPDPKKTALQELAGFIDRKSQEFTASQHESQNGTLVGFENALKKRKELPQQQ